MQRGQRRLASPSPSRPTTEAIGGVWKERGLLIPKFSMKRTLEEAEQRHVTYLNHVRAEVAWYRRHGKHADRIRRDAQGVQYVVGDWSWNRLNPNRREVIEDSLPVAPACLSISGANSPRSGV